MWFTMRFLLLLALTPAGTLANPPAEPGAEARAFFARYVELGTNFDPAVGDLYADDALVKTHRRAADGSASDLQITGAEMKEAIRKVMPMARMRGDVSEYSHIEVQAKGDRATITAHRHSPIKCYTDSTYTMTVERRDGGSYRIVEEYSVTQPQSECPESQQRLSAAFDEMVRQLGGKLPLAVDDDTRLDAVSVVDQRVLRYEYTLVNLTVDELDPTSTGEMLRSILVAQSCGTPELRRLLDLGATLSYVYRGRDGRDIGQIDLRSADCP
jgi:hypothetical protein